MEIRVLNYFLMVAREENITKAANLLHITQPTLSRQLMQLEEEFGVKLFMRNSHKVTLTEDGLLLKRRAQELVSLAEKTKKEMIHEKDIAGEIAIGSGEMMGMSVLAGIMDEFRQKYPKAHFDVYSGNADGIKERIENGLLDAGLLLEPVDISKYEFARMPGKEQWGVVVKEDSSLVEKGFVTPDDIAGLPLITAKRAMVQDELHSWFGETADQLNIVSTYNLMYNSIMQVKRGMGILLCLKLDVQSEGVKFIPLSPTLELGSVLVWKKNQIFSPAVEAFTQFCSQYLKGIS
ncbi:LysR family transcriptional regulator [Hungatella effluvii]|uniref:LysR family transcriptional regulator n=1 Tax=Hungatella effluvii TaxID=1096246 RepID=A0A2V3Y6P4_9FIRM|nr:LysR family transcriptional regulator [Hungatella effluvii]PXX54255.1 LysR family transcriptional regulator [Hungatella effluvii]